MGAGRTGPAAPRRADGITMAKSDTQEVRGEGVEGAPAAPGSEGPKPRRGHRILAAILLVIGALLTPVTITTLYLKTQITDTGRYVSTVEPLASNPAVQAYVADAITNRLFTQVDVPAYLEGILPPRADPLAGPLTSTLKTFTHDATLRVLQSEEFQKVWVGANRVAHSTLVNVLTGDGSAAVRQSSDGAVTIDLSAIGAEVKQRLESTGISAFSKIPTDRIAGEITVFRSQDLYRARRAVGFLDRLAFVLPFLVVGCLGGAVLLSKNRRRGFVAAAIAFTLGALLLAAGLATGRSIYLREATKGGIPRDAATPIFDSLVSMLHTSLRAVLTFSIIVVIVAIFSGPSRLAVWFRERVRRTVSWLGRESDRTGWRLLRPNGFTVRHKGAMRVIVAVVGFVVVFFWHRPTPMVIFWIAVGALAVLALVEFYGRDPTTTPEQNIILGSPEHRAEPA